MNDIVTSDAFTTFEEDALKHKRNAAFVPGIGLVKAYVKNINSDKPLKIQYMLTKIDGDVIKISQGSAQEFVNKSEDWITRSALRRDPVVSSLAEEMAENYGAADVASKSDDYETKSWPYLSETEKDQWRSVAKFAIDRLSKPSVS